MKRMADGINKFIGAGNLASDPELRATQGGQNVLRFRIACTESYKANDGQFKERTEYVQCVIWGARAAALANILHKGMGVTVLGSLRTRSWDDNDGKKRYATEIAVDNVVLPSRGKQSQGDGAPQERRERGQGQPPADDEATGGGYGDDSDIPF